MRRRTPSTTAGAAHAARRLSPGRRPGRALLLHSEGAGASCSSALGRRPRVDQACTACRRACCPQALWHTACAGLDLWLAAIALGASQVWVLLTDREAPQYRRRWPSRWRWRRRFLAGLGYRGEHLRSRSRRDGDLARSTAALRRASTGRAPARVAGPQADKRATLELVLDHLLAQRRTPLRERSRCRAPASPFGSSWSTARKCTLCLACVGACPRPRWPTTRQAAAALHREELRAVRPVRKHLPRRRDHAGPRLWLADAGKARKAARVLHQSEPYCCVRCGKPFGTLKAIEAMIAKIGGHPAFQGAGAERLADVRRLSRDRHPHQPDELKITDL
jgi:ferredoxin